MDHGRDWYPTAERHVTRLPLTYRYPLPAAAGALAAISPGVRWERNLAQGEALIAWDHNGSQGPRPSVETYSTRNVDRAIRCLDGENPATVLGGSKVRAFYRALLGDGRAIVLDSHMANAFRGHAIGLREVKTIGVTEWREWERLIQRSALRYACEPRAIQAVAWIAHKTEKQGLEEVPF